MALRNTRREVQRRKIHEDVADYLLEDIFNGVYKVGEELPSERTLMTEFGVGRPAVRESLAKLARMGVVDIRPGMRSKVRPVSMEPLLEEMDGAIKLTLQTPSGQKNLQQIRMLFEVAVGRSVATTLTPEHLKKIEIIQRQCYERISGDANFAEIAELDVLFHRAIGEASGNPLIVAIYDAFGKWLLEQRQTNFTNPERPGVALRAHQEILDMLKTGDPDQVEKAITEHIRDSTESYWNILEQRNAKGMGESGTQ